MLIWDAFIWPIAIEFLIVIVSPISIKLLLWVTVIFIISSPFNDSLENQDYQFIEFDKSYKKVVSFEWDTEKSIIVAFESGFISVISMDPGALGKELHSFRPSMSPIEQIQIN